MIIKSVNTGSIEKVKCAGKIINTGIFKSPVNLITLGKEDVVDDDVVDRRYHGGIDKACYIYSNDHYDFWRKLYPNLSLDYGMFGENITVDGLDEKNILIGDIYRVGGATVQVTQPRQPCFKLGIRFESQGIIKQFINNDYPGIYVKVLESAQVRQNDSMDLIERQHNSISVLDVWHLLYAKDISQDDLEFAISIPFLADACKSSLRKRIIIS